MYTDTHVILHTCTGIGRQTEGAVHISLWLIFQGEPDPVLTATLGIWCLTPKQSGLYSILFLR